ncbi:MAG: hypothetical protein CMF62_01590 [Magnetococcales bacterium]|nr:hypothetical protein [Magnetococcales bacterium]
MEIKTKKKVNSHPIKVVIDSYEYLLTKNLLEEYHYFDLTKCIMNNFKSKYFVKCDDYFVGNLNHKSFEFMLNYIRGYNVDYNCTYLDMVKFDARRTGFIELYNELNLGQDKPKQEELEMKVSNLLKEFNNLDTSVLEDDDTKFKIDSIQMVKMNELSTNPDVSNMIKNLQNFQNKEDDDIESNGSLPEVL